jgi:hypothetical protein
MPALSFKDYLQLRIDIASKKLEASRHVIQHGDSRGTIAENALQSLINEFLPIRYGIGNGFVLATDGQTSKQIDLLIYDCLSSSPIYRDNAFAVVSPDMPVSVIESKCDLNAQHFTFAVQNIASVKAMNSAVTGIVFAFGGMTAETLGHHLEAETKAIAPELRIDYWLNLERNYVASLDQDRHTYVFTEGPALVITTLLLAVLQAADVNNLLAYLQDGPEAKEILKLSLKA